MEKGEGNPKWIAFPLFCNKSIALVFCQFDQLVDFAFDDFQPAFVCACLPFNKTALALQGVNISVAFQHFVSGFNRYDAYLQFSANNAN